MRNGKRLSDLLSSLRERLRGSVNGSDIDEIER